jgi:hypothetical protein
MSNIDFTVKVVASPGGAKGTPEYTATILEATDGTTNYDATKLTDAYTAVSNMPAKSAGGSSSQSSRGGRSRKGKKSKGGKSRKARKSLRRK